MHSKSHKSSPTTQQCCFFGESRKNIQGVTALKKMKKIEKSHLSKISGPKTSW
jgi:hypothetical protein